MRRSYPAGPNYGRSDVLEDENTQLVEGLRSKTDALKSLTIDIGNEIRGQKTLLDSLDDDFDRTGGFMSNTIGRVGRLLRGSQYKHILYLMLFAFFVFFVLWFIIRFK